MFPIRACIAACDTTLFLANPSYSLVVLLRHHRRFKLT